MQTAPKKTAVPKKRAQANTYTYLTNATSIALDINKCSVDIENAT